MITLAIAFCLTGFYLFYSTSRRAVLKPRAALQRWVNYNISKAKRIGSVLFLFSFLVCLFVLGAASGTFSFLIILKTTASLVVLLAPLRLFKTISLIVFFAIALFLELYITHYAR